MDETKTDWSKTDRMQERKESHARKTGEDGQERRTKARHPPRRQAREEHKKEMIRLNEEAKNHDGDSEAEAPDLVDSSDDED